MGKQQSKAGRPKLPDQERRDQTLPVRFSPRDLVAIRQSAKREGEPLSQWVRRRLGLDQGSRE